MTETWIDWAVKAPGDQSKSGYYGIPNRGLELIRNLVAHDARGYRSYLIQGHRPGEQASWMFSNMTDGTLYQHYPLEAITWTSGGPAQNIAGVGEEHENEVGPWGFPQPFPFTDAQAITDVRLYLTLEGLCPNLGAPILGAGLETHRRVAPGTTTCPNGRDRYDKYNLIGQEDENDMTPEDRAMLKEVRDRLRNINGPHDNQWIQTELMALRAAFLAAADALARAADTQGSAATSEAQHPEANYTPSQ